VAGREEKAAIRHAIERMQALIAAMTTRSIPISPFTWRCCGRAATGFYAQLTGFYGDCPAFSIQTTNRYKGVQLASIADHKKVADAILAARPWRPARRCTS